MSYDHTKQFRCTIVRGKALNDLDNLLPAYAHVIDKLCPCTYESFKEGFNRDIAAILGNDTQKTLDNHRTEIAGKLFGMYYKDRDGNVYASERTLKLIEDRDQPAFFKDLCYKYQFPSGMSKISTVADQLDKNVGIRQLSYAIKLLHEAHKKDIRLTKKEVGYYVLNSLDVLQGRAEPSEVINALLEDRNNNIEREISYPSRPNANYPYRYQHINEQLDLLVLANLIVFDGGYLVLNTREAEFINILERKYNAPPIFDFSKYDLQTPEGRKDAELDWDKHFSELSEVDSDKLVTTSQALAAGGQATTTSDTTALGDEGELYVYNMEKARVESIKPHLVRKIKMLGKIKGIGYDIQSVYATGDNPEFVNYIEVKTTRRVTPLPDTFEDTVNLTRNEWMAAQQHGKHYAIYRVYFTQHKTAVFKMTDPYKLNEDGRINTIATNYRMDFNNKSGALLD